MSTEVYSKRMAVAVRRELRQADGPSFKALIEYYRQRGGPGLALAEQEATDRATRTQLNYPPQAVHSLLTANYPMLPRL
jgi:hypothetical protein